MSQSVTAIGDALLTEEQARAKIRRRLRRSPTGTSNGEFLLHPMWIAQAEVIADRPPLRPVVRPTLIFVDAVSEYRGQLTTVPHTQQVDRHASTVHRVRIRDEQRARELVQDVQTQQINRSYVLRKPRHEIRRLELLYLPLWRFDPGEGGDIAVVNAVT
ncbi:MAG TPA: hypothetical protein VK053_22135, partial [Jiangellaceae bacterium]|nr:hypothetical protein [Jiangellaceae bacterium]